MPAAELFDRAAKHILTAFGAGSYVDAEVQPYGLSAVALLHTLRRAEPPKRTLLRQGYGGYPPRIHPRVYTRDFLRRRVKRIKVVTGSANPAQCCWPYGIAS